MLPICSFCILKVLGEWRIHGERIVVFGCSHLSVGRLLEVGEKFFTENLWNSIGETWSVQ